MHTNDEWLVEHVWNITQFTTNNDGYLRRLKEIQKEGNVLDMIRKSKHQFLLSGEEDKETIQLRGEVNILHQQLEESQQETTQTRRQSNSNLKETLQTLQDVMESHQQEMKRSNTRLQEVQVKLQETQVQLQV